jgi:hypothetical protein
VTGAAVGVTGAPDSGAEVTFAMTGAPVGGEGLNGAGTPAFPFGAQSHCVTKAGKILQKLGLSNPIMPAFSNSLQVMSPKAGKSTMAVSVVIFKSASPQMLHGLYWNPIPMEPVGVGVVGTTGTGAWVMNGAAGVGWAVVGWAVVGWEVEISAVIGGNVGASVGGSIGAGV